MAKEKIQKARQKGAGHVFKRGLTWYLQFDVNGKRKIISLKTKLEREAQAKAAELMEIASADTKEKIADHVAKARQLKARITLTLANAFDASLKKPSRRKASPTQIQAKRRYWDDFVAFMEACHPETKSIADVTKPHAEEYIQTLRTDGRHDKAVVYDIGRKTATYSRKGGLSPRTVNVFHTVLAEVFEKLKDEAGLAANPFKAVPKTSDDSVSRDAFTEEELRLIGDNLDKDPFVKVLFVVGVTTGLREGDICTLKWSEVDLPGGFITRETRKTGALVEIPITPPLRRLIEAQTRDSEYVFPAHAELYLRQGIGVSYRFRGFLEGVGIKTTRKAKGREREVSIKDVHSLRHTFCYYAGVNRIPLAIVASIVGHMSPEMTKHYQAHANKKDKTRFMAAMPELLGAAPVKIAALPPARPPLPAYAVEALESMDAGNWEAIRKQLLDGGMNE